eukprot:scpid5135/ scgid15196/ 
MLLLVYRVSRTTYCQVLCVLLSWLCVCCCHGYVLVAAMVTSSADFSTAMGGAGTAPALNCFLFVQPQHGDGMFGAWIAWTLPFFNPHPCHSFLYPASCS